MSGRGPLGHGVYARGQTIVCGASFRGHRTKACVVWCCVTDFPVDRHARPVSGVFIL